MAKGDKFSLNQCPMNNFKEKLIQKIFLCKSCKESNVYSVLYAFGYCVQYFGMLGRYLRNLRLDHWKAAKWVIRYLKKTKYYMLIYWRSDQLEIIWYTDFNIIGCKDNVL
jgi:hypothetical protein